MHTIVYAHGFKSSARSRKATQLRDYLRDHHRALNYLAPDLSFDPEAALAQLAQCCADVAPDQLTVVGSSLGGFYALWLAEKFACRAVLLNPSIRPFDTLARYLGPQQNIYTGETFVFAAAHVAALRARFIARPTRPARYLLIVETGDEVLDYRAAVDYYAGARQIVIEGGDHELKSFPRHIPALLEFAGTTR
jgi:uncharacterized protein